MNTSILDKPIVLSLNRAWQVIGHRTVKQALIALTFRAMTARNFPVLKRAMGHARTCQRVRIGNADIAVNPMLKAA